MTTLLLVECSPRLPGSASRQLGRRLLGRLADRQPGLRIIERDLVREPLPPIDGEYAAAMERAPEHRTAGQRLALDLSERLIGELEAADILMIATPMHNYTVPAALKLWIDHIVRIGRSFRSTAEGKVGLLKDRPTLIAVASGGAFSGAAARQPDFLTDYLRAVLATVGIRDIQFVSAENLARDAAPLETIRRQADAWLPGDAFFLTEEFS